MCIRDRRCVPHTDFHRDRTQAQYLSASFQRKPTLSFSRSKDLNSFFLNIRINYINRAGKRGVDK